MEIMLHHQNFHPHLRKSDDSDSRGIFMMKSSFLNLTLSHSLKSRYFPEKKFSEEKIKMERSSGNIEYWYV